MGEEGRLGRMGPAVCVMVRPSLDGIWQRDDIIYIYIYIYIYISCSLLSHVPQLRLFPLFLKILM